MEFKAESLEIIGDKFIFQKLCEQEIVSCKKVRNHYEILCCFFEYLYFYYPQCAFQILDNLHRKNPQVSYHIQAIYAYMTIAEKENYLLGDIYLKEDYIYSIRSIADYFSSNISVKTYNKEFRFETYIKLIMHLSMTFEIICIDNKKTGRPFASLKKISYGIGSILFLSLEKSLYMLLPKVMSNELILNIINSINSSENLQKVLFHCGHSIPLQVSNLSDLNNYWGSNCKICNEKLYTMDIGLAKKNYLRDYQKTKNQCGNCSKYSCEFLCIDCEWPLCRDCVKFNRRQLTCGLCKFMSTIERFQRKDVANKFLNMRKAYLSGQIIHNNFVNSNQCYKSNTVQDTLRLEVNSAPHPINGNSLSKDNFSHTNASEQKFNQYMNYAPKPSGSQSVVNPLVNLGSIPETHNQYKNYKACAYCHGLFDNSSLQDISGIATCKGCCNILRSKCLSCNKQNLCNAIICSDCCNISYEGKLIDLAEFCRNKNFFVVEKKCKKCQTTNIKINDYCDYCKNKTNARPQIIHESMQTKNSQCYFDNCINQGIRVCIECRENPPKFCEDHMQIHMKKHNSSEGFENKIMSSESKNIPSCQTCHNEQKFVESILCSNCKMLHTNSEFFYHQSTYQELYNYYENLSLYQKKCSNCNKYPIETKNYCEDCIPLLSAKKPETEPHMVENFPQNISRDHECSTPGCKIINCNKCSICQLAYCPHDMENHKIECHKSVNIPEMVIAPSSNAEPLGDFIKKTRKNVINSYHETIQQMQNYSHEMLKLLDEIENADDSLKKCIGSGNYFENHCRDRIIHLEHPELVANHYDSKTITKKSTELFLKDIEVMRKKFDDANQILKYFREEKSKILSESVDPQKFLNMECDDN
ncbi:hypothetical protein SteCoe_2575 [Stentor coeruleus]|uniref:Uncharacterized protein n=1 Tax=Stentor coeruleus TaxID=5963 RepID=A0A1R2CZ35_9CILI|nr:hypothetical protein SteCoe_2575 [Stentor coeruleus]